MAHETPSPRVCEGEEGAGVGGRTGAEPPRKINFVTIPIRWPEVEGRRRVGPSATPRYSHSIWCSCAQILQTQRHCVAVCRRRHARSRMWWSPPPLSKWQVLVTVLLVPFQDCIFEFSAVPGGPMHPPDIPLPVSPGRPPRLGGTFFLAVYVQHSDFPELGPGGFRFHF